MTFEQEKITPTKVGYRRWLLLKENMRGLWYHWSRKPHPQKFVLFAQGRTGSSFLVDLLNNHSQIDCRGELLKPYFRIGIERFRGRKYFPLSFVEGMSKTSAGSWFGFKVKIYQLDKQPYVPDVSRFIDRLEARNWKLIYLYRDNVFEHAISNIVAKAFYVYHQREEKKVSQVHVDLAQLLRLMRERLEFLDREKEVLKGREYLSLEYESDLNKNTAETLKRIQDYLGLPNEQLQSELKKIVNRSYADVIENYDEVLQCLKDNGFERYIKTT